MAHGATLPGLSPGLPTSIVVAPPTQLCSGGGQIEFERHTHTAPLAKRDHVPRCRRASLKDKDKGKDTPQRQKKETKALLKPKEKY